jgi:hypothetical protein
MSQNGGLRKNSDYGFNHGDSERIIKEAFCVSVVSS